MHAHARLTFKPCGPVWRFVEISAYCLSRRASDRHQSRHKMGPSDCVLPNWKNYSKKLVRKGGLEPPRVAPPDPKSGASANFATFAWTSTDLLGPVRSGVTGTSADSSIVPCSIGEGGYKSVRVPSRLRATGRQRAGMGVWRTIPKRTFGRRTQDRKPRWSMALLGEMEGIAGIVAWRR